MCFMLKSDAAETFSTCSEDSPRMGSLESPSALQCCSVG